MIFTYIFVLMEIACGRDDVQQIDRTATKDKISVLPYEKLQPAPEGNSLMKVMFVLPQPKQNILFFFSFCFECRQKYVVVGIVLKQLLL